jgi:hypothetical protein
MMPRRHDLGIRDATSFWGQVLVDNSHRFAASECGSDSSNRERAHDTQA